MKVDRSYIFHGSSSGYTFAGSFDLLMGNISGAQNPNDSVGGWETCAAAVTMALAWKYYAVKLLITSHV